MLVLVNLVLSRIGLILSVGSASLLVTSVTYEPVAHSFPVGTPTDSAFTQRSLLNRPLSLSSLARLCGEAPLLITLGLTADSLAFGPAFMPCEKLGRVESCN